MLLSKHNKQLGVCNETTILLCYKILFILKTFKITLIFVEIYCRKLKIVSMLSLLNGLIVYYNCGLVIKLGNLKKKKKDKPKFGIKDMDLEFIHEYSIRSN